MQNDPETQRYNMGQLLESLSFGAMLQALAQRRQFIYGLAVIGFLLGTAAGFLLPRNVTTIAVLRDASPARYIDIQIPEVFTLRAVDVVRRLRRELTSFELLSDVVNDVRTRRTHPYLDFFRTRIDIDRLNLKVAEHLSISIQSPHPAIGAEILNAHIRRAVDEHLSISIQSPHPAIGAEILSAHIRRAIDRTEQLLRNDVKVRVEIERRRSQYLVNTTKPRFESAVEQQIAKLNEEASRSATAITSNRREVGRDLFVDEYSKHVQRLKFLEGVKVDAIKFGLIDIDRPPGAPPWVDLRHVGTSAILGLVLGVLLGLLFIYGQFVKKAFSKAIPL